MANGYAGKILKINLTTREISAIDTANMRNSVRRRDRRGHFLDLAVAPGDWDLQDAFDPRNVISLMTGPLAGTACRARQNQRQRHRAGDISDSFVPPDQYGGRFATMLKAAGGTGWWSREKSDRPVWINIVNDKSQSKTPRNSGGSIPMRPRAGSCRWWAEGPGTATNGRSRERAHHVQAADRCIGPSEKQ